MLKLISKLNPFKASDQERREDHHIQQARAAVVRAEKARIKTWEQYVEVMTGRNKW